MVMGEARWGWGWWALAFLLLACGVFVVDREMVHWQANMEAKAPWERAAPVVNEIDILGGQAIADEAQPGQPVVSVSLGGTKVLDVQLVHLQRLSCLKLLDLRSTSVTDSGLVHLAGMTQLRKLDLRGTKVTAAGVARLRKALPEADIIWP
jgi:hypothetical protein